MEHKLLLTPIKILGVFLLFTLVLIIPICAIFAPITYLGSIFGNSMGTIKENFGGEYDQDFSRELDDYMNQNRLSVDYNGVLGCVFYETTNSPSECLSSIDANTGRLNEVYESEEFLKIENKLHIGKYNDSYFSDIHVLGKYTTTEYELVDSHYEEIEGVQTLVEEYDWVYHPEIKRGKCIDSDTVACNIILEDKDVYPYQAISFNKEKGFGLVVDPKTYETSFNTFQEWQGDMLYAFSKASVVEADNSKMILSINANGIDLYAKYESVDNWLSPLFLIGETVEATEVIAYSEGNTRLTLYNSNNELINPAIFIKDITYFPGLGNGTIIYGMEDFAPDFNNTKIWNGPKSGGINPYGDDNMGQCTWFAWGLFYQHYGFDPGFRVDGSSCAYEAYQHLKDQGWTYSRSPSPGAIFSTTNFNHVGIVAGVIDDNTMIIVEGNFNHRNDTLQEFINLPDWSMRTVSTKQYKPGVGFVFCNPPVD